MTTVITIKDAVFTAPGLPVLSRVIRDGLVLGIRPADTGDVVDFSDNGATLTKVGFPILTPYGVRTAPVSFYNTSVLESSSNTMIIGFRAVFPGSTSGLSGLLGSLNYGFGTNSKGSGIAVGTIAGSPAYLGAATYAANGATTRQNTGARAIVSPSPAPPFTSKWVWVAVALDEAANVSRFYSCMDGGDLVAAANATLDAGVITRTRANICLGAYADVGVDTGHRFEIAEALVYSRALSAAEIQHQFNEAKKYMTSIGAVLGQ